jgi:hypothetical protein
MWHNNLNVSGEGHLAVVFSQRGCGLISHEEDHEETQ